MTDRVLGQDQAVDLRFVGPADLDGVVVPGAFGRIAAREESGQISVSTHGRRHGQRVWSWPHGAADRRTKYVLGATIDLAEEIAVVDANDTPEVEHARAEIARLRG
jgi:hypothetical protein